MVTDPKTGERKKVTRSRTLSANRIAYILKKGPIPENPNGTSTRHPKHSVEWTCGNEGCINFRHLVLGKGVGRKAADEEHRVITRGIDFTETTLDAIAYIQEYSGTSVKRPNEREVISSVIEKTATGLGWHKGLEDWKQIDATREIVRLLPDEDRHMIKRGIRFYPRTLRAIEYLQDRAPGYSKARPTQRQIIADAVEKKARTMGWNG